MNGDDFYKLKRFSEESKEEEEEKKDDFEAGTQTSDQISATAFSVNEIAILVPNSFKTLRAMQSIIGRHLEGMQELQVESISLKDLNCSSSNFVNLFEFLYQKIPNPEFSNPLLELTLDGLPTDLIISDDNLIERFGRSA